MYKYLDKNKQFLNRFRKIEVANPKFRLYSKLCQTKYPSYSEYVQKELKWIENANELILETSFIRRGFYTEQIQHWFNFFPENQFYFLDYQRLINLETVSLELRKLVAVLGISSNGIRMNKILFHNSRNYPPITNQLPGNLHQALLKLYSDKNKDIKALTELDLSWAN